MSVTGCEQSEHRKLPEVLLRTCPGRRGASSSRAPHSHHIRSAVLQAQQLCKDNIDLKFKSNVVT